MTPPDKDNLAFLKSLTATLETVAKSLGKSKQIGTSRKPYYDELYGGYVRELIDKVVSSGQPHIIPVGDHTFYTIRAQWYQGLEYLVDHLDPTYRNKCGCLKVEGNHKRGLTISPKPEKGILAAYAIVPWKKPLLDFIDEAQHRDKFERIGLPLTEDDINWVIAQLNPVKDLFIYNIDERQIQIVRVDKSKLQNELDNE